MGSGALHKVAIGRSHLLATFIQWLVLFSFNIHSNVDLIVIKSFFNGRQWCINHMRLPQVVLICLQYSFSGLFCFKAAFTQR